MTLATRLNDLGDRQSSNRSAERFGRSDMKNLRARWVLSWNEPYGGSYSTSKSAQNSGVGGHGMLALAHFPCWDRQGMNVVLVRHAGVQVEPGVPSKSWRLSADGQRAAEALGQSRAIRTAAVIASSPEPKAFTTAEAVAHGRRIFQLAQLSELDRSEVGWLANESDHIQLVQEIFEQPTLNVRGCESAVHAQQRFVRAIDVLRQDDPSVDLVVVSHGIVLSLFIAGIRRLPKPELAHWQSIRMPDIAVIDPLRMEVLSDFGSLPLSDRTV